jgi:hypothetical protein
MVDTEANLCISSLQVLYMRKGKYTKRWSFIVGTRWSIDYVGGAFRHGPKKHGIAFPVVAVITQLAIEKGESLFDWEYAVEYDM